jgi:hypothetical protein
MTLSCPGRGAAPLSGAPQSRDRPKHRLLLRPGSAAHDAEGGALRCVRGTHLPYFSVAVSASENSSSVRSSRSGVTET